MILEKIKEHANKISFFIISLLLIVIGVLYLKQQNLKSLLSGAKQQNSNLLGVGTVGRNVNNAPVKTPKTSTATNIPSATTKAPSSTTKVS